VPEATHGCDRRVEISMSERYFEDWHVGDRLESDTVIVTEEAIRTFAREYDPQPFHLGHEAAQGTLFGRLTASGWQTAGYSMRLLVLSGALGPGGVGLGVDELRWLRPVYPDDELRIVVECTGTRANAAKPTGIVHLKIATYNQRGEEVMRQITAAMLPRRKPADG
jgi:acyl dehydratase